MKLPSTQASSAVVVGAASSSDMAAILAGRNAPPAAWTLLHEGTGLREPADRHGRGLCRAVPAWAGAAPAAALGRLRDRRRDRYRAVPAGLGRGRRDRLRD